MTDEDRVRLHHMLDASKKAIALVSEISLAQYTTAENYVLRAATERFMEIVGEAAHHVSDELKEQHPDVPWQQIAGMRNHLIHGYMNTDDEVVWKTAVKDAPLLLKELEHILGTTS